MAQCWRRLCRSRVAPQATDRDSFYGAVGHVIILAQCFGMFPVQGVQGKDASQLRFHCCSLRVVYSGLVLLGAFVLSGFTCVRLYEIGFTYPNTAAIAFYGNGFLAILLFLHLATRWPGLARAWDRADRALQRHYGYPHRLRRRLQRMVAVLMSIALFEHVLANMTGIRVALQCSRGGLDGLRVFSLNAFQQVFLHVGYSHWVGAATTFLNVVETFSWSYTDLFLMVVCVALAERFRQLNARLRAARGQVLPENTWRQFREDYNTLSYLTKTLDATISQIVLFSFANNLYFICLQLFKSVSLVHDWGILYFYMSFGYVLGRTAAVLFCAAAVNDESKVARLVLYSVPSESYGVEVQRFLMQSVCDEVALTGLSFFSITRTLILTVAGTIATYEVVLLQLEGLNPSAAPSNATNATSPCP